MADTSTSYKCPSCSAPLNYKPGSGDSIKCEYCETEFTAKILEEYFSAQNDAAAQAKEAEDSKWKTEEAGNNWDKEDEAIMRAMTCSSCGAEIVCDENTMATECCYCGNPTMVAARFDKNKGLKPDTLIPFKKTKDDAMKAFKEFHAGKWLLPDNFATRNRMEAIQGMYVPFWLFDSSIKANATFSAQRIRCYSDGDYDVTETDHYRCYRSGNMKFNLVPGDGSEKMDDTWMESIEPFNYGEMEAFNTTYMAGYLADKYDVDAAQMEPRIEKRMNETASDVLRESVVGYDSVSMDDCNINKKEGDVKYCMAPVWILTNRFKDKPYTFIMNGQTGKLVGSLPIDEGKVKKYWALGTLVSLIPCYYIAKLIVELVAAIIAS